MSIRSVKAAGRMGLKVGNRKKSSDSGAEKEEDDKIKSSCNDLDDVLEVVGSQGKYQKTFLYAIISPLTAMEPLLGLNLIFMLYEPDHWCSVPGREEAGVDLDTWKNLTIPREADGTLSKCQMYGSNRSVVTACTSGWEYDKKDYDHTVPSDFDWVCERGEWATWVLTANALGNAIGTVALGQAADKVGRKPVFVITLALHIFGRIASLYVADNFWLFAALGLITGLGYPVIYICPLMIGAEISSKEYRAWVNSWTWVIWIAGMGSLPWIAYFLRHWYTIALVTTIPCAIAFLLCLWMPESPRWLLSQGKVSQAAKVIKEIAKRNGTEGKLSDFELDSMLKQIVIKQDQSDQSSSMITLFSERALAINTILVTVTWTMSGVSYYAITLNAQNLSGNQFLNFFILALTEVPAGFTGSFLCDRVGRRWTQVLFFLVILGASSLAGVAAGLTAAAEHGPWTTISVLAAVAAKFAIALTFMVIYLQAAEIFPTPLRSTGSGFASTIASIGGIFTPYIVYTGRLLAGAPWFIIGAMSVVGMVSSAFLPETLNQRLPETLEDAAGFGKGHKFWSLRPPSAEETTTFTKPGEARSK